MLRSCCLQGSIDRAVEILPVRSSQTKRCTSWPWRSKTNVCGIASWSPSRKLTRSSSGFRERILNAKLFRESRNSCLVAWSTDVQSDDLQALKLLCRSNAECHRDTERTRWRNPGSGPCLCTRKTERLPSESSSPCLRELHARHGVVPVGGLVITVLVAELVSVLLQAVNNIQPHTIEYSRASLQNFALIIFGPLFLRHCLTGHTILPSTQRPRPTS